MHIRTDIFKWPLHSWTDYFKGYFDIPSYSLHMPQHLLDMQWHRSKPVHVL